MTSPIHPRARKPLPVLTLVVLTALVTLVAAACSAGDESAGSPDELALIEDTTPRPAAATTTTVGVTTTTFPTPSTLWPDDGVADTPPPTPPPIPHGDVNNPFGPLPPTDRALAVTTASGVVVPVISEGVDGWLVSTVCHNVQHVSDATPIGRAHVMLDPGHGGAEPGATGPSGLRESDLNLQVSTRAAEILRSAGATVVLTRTGDYALTAAARGQLAEAVQPGLLVSVHHNGGAPPRDDRPGTLVYAKTASPESSRFGGLFYQVMQPMLDGAAEPKRVAYAEYAEALDLYEAEIAAYDESVRARDAALVANGQLPPEAATTIPAPTPVAPGDFRLPSQRELPTTTTIPPTNAAPVPVPDSLPLPPPFTAEPIREFHWAGAGNAGVRSWTRADGEDYLAVLRHSGEVPAVLAEFLYVTNPSEEELLADPEFIEKEAGALADAVILYFTTDGPGTGFVADQFDDQPIGGSGSVRGCVEPPL